MPPERVVAHLGPTNSGKTHAALEELAAKGAGVYAGPLRMLAQEAHRRLGERIGAGERRARHGRGASQRARAGDLLARSRWRRSRASSSSSTRSSGPTTPSAAPRGRRLLLAGEYREILLLGALDALPLVERAFPEAELKVFERKLPLEFVGERTLRSLAPGTVVVAFSRKAVLALAGEVNRLHPGRVAVLYGAMPLASRREEIERFLSGAADVCVATDVLGHGVNLPCETLLFAETTKFDGEERRDLLPWELAQIAGRAGRFGLVERGHVGVLAGLGWGVADPQLVESALEPHVPLPGGHWGYRVVDEARIRPRLSDLGVDDAAAPRRGARRLAPRGASRVGVRELARRRVARSRSGFGSKPFSAVLRSAGARLSLDGHVEARQRARSTRTTLELLATLALALAGDRVARPQLNFLLDTARLRGASLEDAEQAGREASILRWFALQYPGVGGVTIERAAALEEAAAERVVARLRVEVESPTLGRCRSCGRSCAPWFPLCERCAGIAARS